MSQNTKRFSTLDYRTGDSILKAEKAVTRIRTDFVPLSDKCGC
jgi:hypothetical protein